MDLFLHKDVFSLESSPIFITLYTFLIVTPISAGDKSTAEKRLKVVSRTKKLQNRFLLTALLIKGSFSENL